MNMSGLVVAPQTLLLSLLGPLLAKKSMLHLLTADAIDQFSSKHFLGQV